jgi:hypothetical protein
VVAISLPFGSGGGGYLHDYTTLYDAILYHSLYKKLYISYIIDSTQYILYIYIYIYYILYTICYILYTM